MQRLLVIVLIGVVILILSGPRVSTKYQLNEIDLPDDLDLYLTNNETQFFDLKPGTEKQIIWAHSDKRRTKISLIYLHGFSATRREVTPLAERVACALGANLYFARLTGHGRSPEAMAEASLQAWLDDTQEAMAIGRQIGKQVVIIGTSNGGTLGIWLSFQSDEPLPMTTVLISPNFGPLQWQSTLLTWPWAKYFVPFLHGDIHAWTPHNEDHARYWTTHYPVSALFPMAASVALVRMADPATLRTPVLTFYSPNDRVVDSQRIERFFQRLIVTPRKLVAIEDSGDPHHHVLAGDILSPGLLLTDLLSTLLISCDRSHPNITLKPNCCNSYEQL